MTTNEVSQLIAKEVVNAIKVLTERNNQTYVNNQIANYAGSSNNVLQNLYARIANLAVANVKRAVIDTAEIDSIYGSYGEFIHTVTEQAEVDNLDTGTFDADIASIGIADIASTEIDWASIKTLIAEDAIIEKGLGGQLSVAEFNVDDKAKVVAVTVGELVLRNENGGYARIKVDANGNLSTEPVSVDADGEVIYGQTGEGILVQDSITTRELTSSTIFCNEATIDRLTANHIDVASLFSDEAFINKITTTLIQDPTFSVQLVLTGGFLEAIAENLSLDASRVTIGSGDAKRPISDVLSEFEEEVDGAVTEATAAKQIVDSVKGTIDMIVTRGDSSSEIKLTPKMIAAISNNIVLNASRVVIGSTDTTSDIAKRLIAMDNSIDTIQTTADDALGIATQAFLDVDSVSGKIGLVVADGSTATNLKLTPNMISAISKNVVVTADTINQIADEIDLSGNDTVRITADKINQVANQIDLSGNNTINITAEKINQVADDIQLVGNKSISMLVGDSAWFTFDNKSGFVVRRPAYTDEDGVEHPVAVWYTSTKEDSFNVNRTDKSTPILSCVQDRVKTPSLQIGGSDDSTDIAVRRTHAGGWVWGDA